jgi:integrase
MLHSARPARPHCRPQLTLVHRLGPVVSPILFPEVLADHQAILQGYLDTHVTRNHSEHTIGGARRFLIGWHAGFPVPDARRPDGTRQLFVWEAMAPVAGRERIVAFAKGLIEAGLKPRTIHGYLGVLRRLYQYVLDYPYIPSTDGQSVVAKYGPLAQPVSEYDYSVHTIDQEDEGVILTGERLDQFYDYVRYEYVARNQKKLPASRDYTMIVVAGECGLRASEIAHLDARGPHRALFYQEQRLQTCAGKGVRDSGPRVRKTLFAPGTQETMRAS